MLLPGSGTIPISFFKRKTFITYPVLSRVPIGIQTNN